MAAATFPDACSNRALDIGEPLAGTAPFAPTWIAIEQNGPFGRDALTESHLDPEIGQRVAQACDSFSIRPALIRHPGRHADDHSKNLPRTVYIADGRPGQAQLVKAVIEDPIELLRIDYAAIAAGELMDAHPLVDPVDEAILLVCSHARRDVCCARKGRPIALEVGLDPQFLDRVWECSHLGGHRFAATAVQLPHGWVHGRLNVESAKQLLLDADAGLLQPDLARGRSALTPSAQAADIAYRQACDIHGIDATRVRELSANTYAVSTLAGIEGTVKTEVVELAEARPESCSKPSVHGSYLSATVL